MTAIPATASRATVLPPGVWQARAGAHRTRVHAATAGHRERRAAGIAHPVEDFLYTYYPFSPGKLAMWHPGAGTELDDAAEYEGRRFYHRTERGTFALDAGAYLAERGEGLLFIRELLQRTRERAGRFGCFGMHEWAMVYRTDEARHSEVPLRLGGAGTDAVVEGHRIQCSHFDAFRFFTPEATGRNELQPRRETMREMEQPGCLHAGMDLYKWAMKLGPLIPSELTFDCFVLAHDIRTLDMRASPYDLSDWGYAPVRVETAEGKAEYVKEQRVFSERGQGLRSRLLNALDAVG